jgi:hypothetical protein
MDNDRIRRVTSPVGHGNYSIRVEVRPGDDPCECGGERAEVLIMSDAYGNPINENLSSGTQFYAFSVRFDSNWQPPEEYKTDPWGIIFQLHGPDSLGESPSFAISATDRLGVELTSGDLDSPSRSYRTDQQFSNSALNVGHWIDLVIKINFANDFSGSAEVWRRDEGNSQFTQVIALKNIPTLQYRSSQGGVGDHYWKYGYYRSEQATITNVLFLGGLARGSTFDNVVTVAFAPVQNQSLYIPFIRKYLFHWTEPTLLQQFIFLQRRCF